LKTTKKQFEIFKEECEKWIDYFGLKNWQVEYEHVEIERGRAQACFNCVGGVAVLSLDIDWDESSDFVNDKNVRKSAFHEVCELLFGRINDMVGQRWGLIEEDVEEEIHRLIRTLENVVFKNAN
jgi:hypothetical protein